MSTPGASTDTVLALPAAASGETVPVRPARSWRGPLRRHHAPAVFLVYAVLGLLANYPAWPGSSSRIGTCVCGGNEDPTQTVWFLAWLPYAILHGRNPFLTNVINVPFGANLAQNTGIPLLGLLTAPLTLAVSPVASENLLRWLSFPLSAFAMYFVLRRWTRWAPAAFAGGLFYGFSPYMIGQGSVHVDLAFVPLPPLILYALHQLVTRPNARFVRRGLVLGALMVAQFYISAEILGTTVLVAAIAGLLLVLLRPRSVPRRAVHTLGGLGVAAVVLLACIAYPLLLLAGGPGHYVGPSQGPVEVYNADLLGPILPTASLLVAPHRLATAGSNLVGGLGDIDENGSYLGLPLLALLSYFAVRYWRRRWIGFAMTMAVICFVLSLGPRLVVDGRERAVRLPFALLSHLPLMQDALPVRLSLYVALFSATVLALGLDAFHDGVVARHGRTTLLRRDRVLAGAVVAGRLVGALVLLAALVALLPKWPYRSLPGTPPPAEQPAALAAIPTGGAVLTYPYATPFDDDAMLWQSLDRMRFRIFGSYILRRGAGGGATALAAELSPLDVQTMLSDPLAPVAIPGLPYLEPTARTVVARLVVVETARAVASRARTATLRGIVDNVNLGNGSFYVIDPRGLGLTGVTVTPTTRFIDPGPLASPLLRVQRGDRVAVYGRLVAGTVDPHRVLDLRSFVRLHHVSAIVVELGRIGSTEVAAWMRDAFGAPSRVRPGGEIWLHPQPPARHLVASRARHRSRPRHPPTLVALVTRRAPGTSAPTAS
ncbi:MAG TPA: hypothetical protein VMU75_12450 [Acidimicrobiales bacterium]|nr:hypothetical protein [Acidimicrobiales bacterium]